jgi:hypothetical protein
MYDEYFFSDYVERIIEIFMDDFTVYDDSLDKCLENLSLVLKRCIETNLVLNYEKCYFMIEQGIVLGHVMSSRGLEVDKAKIDVISSLSSRGLEVDKAKIDVISSLSYPSYVREVCSILPCRFLSTFCQRFLEDYHPCVIF